MSDWLTGETREYVRRVALGPGEPQEAVLSAYLCFLFVNSSLF